MRPYRIVLASPSDLAPERNLLADTVIPELNRTLGRQKNVFLDLYRWETDSRPGFHPTGPQGLVDESLPITSCDLLIAVFWKRFGTPILSSPETGTEHEIALAYAQWAAQGKPDLAIYFKEEPFFSSSVRDAEQFLLVNQFRAEFDPKGKYAQGLYGVFRSTQEFERTVRDLLTAALLQL